MLKITLLPQAAEDLDKITEPLFSEIIARLRLLEEFPALGPAMDGPFFGYRCLTVNVFRIVYRIPTSESIEIAYIRHTRRKLSQE